MKNRKEGTGILPFLQTGTLRQSRYSYLPLVLRLLRGSADFHENNAAQRPLLAL